MGAFLKITRPINILITMIASFAAYFIAIKSNGALFSKRELILLIIITGFSAAAGNIINDIYDLEVDRINKPSRVLPGGKMSIRAAIAEYFLLVFIALMASLSLGNKIFYIVIVINLLLFFYAFIFKQLPLIKNFLVAAISGYLFYFCSITVVDRMAVLNLAISAFLFHFAREIIKDIADLEGDQKNNANTFAIYFGLKKAKLVAIFLLILLNLFLIYLIFFKNYGILFNATILIFVIPLLVFIIVKAFTKDNYKYFENLSKLLKADMIFGILAFVLAYL